MLFLLPRKNYKKKVTRFWGGKKALDYDRFGFYRIDRIFLERGDRIVCRARNNLFIYSASLQIKGNESRS